MRPAVTRLETTQRARAPLPLPWKTKTSCTMLIVAQNKMASPRTTHVIQSFILLPEVCSSTAAAYRQRTSTATCVPRSGDPTERAFAPRHKGAEGNWAGPWGNWAGPSRGTHHAQKPAVSANCIGRVHFVRHLASLRSRLLAQDGGEDQERSEPAPPGKVPRLLGIVIASSLLRY